MATLLVMRHGQSTADLEDRIGGSYDAGDTCLYEFDVTSIGTRVRRINDTSHLLHPPLTT